MNQLVVTALEADIKTVTTQAGDGVQTAMKNAGLDTTTNGSNVVGRGLGDAVENFVDIAAPLLNAEVVRQ